MKKSSKVLAVILAVITILTAIAIPSFADAGGEWIGGNYNGFDYEVYDGKASITGYTGSATKLIIPSKVDGYQVVDIWHGAFSDCTSITSVTFPDTVTGIGHQSFYGCTKLKNITIPDSVTFIGIGAFDNTKYYNTESNWENGALYIDNHLVGTNEDLSGAYTIKSGTITIADNVFYYAGDITSITIPASLKAIGGASLDVTGTAFMFCNKLTEIKVSSSNKYFSSKDGVLFNKNKTELIQYPRGKNATSYTIPSTVKTIGDGAFNWCTKLKKVTISDGVVTIGTCAFEECSGLTSITIPKSVKLIGISAFYNCDGLTTVTIGSGVTRIDDWAFSYCDNIASITIPNSVKTIGWGAFFSCPSLSKVIIGTGVTEIESWAFAYCDSLTSITIPANVKTIGDTAFYKYDEDYIFIPIKGYKGTYAETYANEMGHPFTSLGSIPTSKTGLYKVGDTWCYVKGGKVNYDYTGLTKYNGEWYYVEDGVKDSSFIGLYKYSGKWYYVKNGVVDKSYTGLVKHTDGKWYYVKNGVKTTYTGLCKYSGKWYYVNKGVVDFKYTGLCKYSSKWYYVKKGVVDFTYTGNVKYNGKIYKVKNGVKV